MSETTNPAGETPANGGIFTTEEEAELDELGAELASLEKSPWQPLCIAEAFARPARGKIVLTMQRWIDLEAMRSSLLLGELPELAELRETFAIFDLDLDALDPEEALLIAREMREVVFRRYEMSCPMAPAESQPPEPDQGFGYWAALLAYLKTEGGMSLAEALGTPVPQALVLLASHRANQGWKLKGGTPYAWREVGHEKEAE